MGSFLEEVLKTLTKLSKFLPSKITKSLIKWFSTIDKKILSKSDKII